MSTRTEALQQIEQITSVEDARRVYDTCEFVQSALRDAYKSAAKYTSVTKWAEDWARSKNTHDAEAALSSKEVKQIEDSRKVCLSLLYKMYDVCESNAEGNKDAGRILDAFGEERVSNVLGVFLALDRANALYHMRLPNASKPGIHWFSKQHKEENNAVIAPHLQDYDGFAPINKRLVWFCQNLQLPRALNEWIEPQPAPWAQQ